MKRHIGVIIGLVLGLTFFAGCTRDSEATQGTEVYESRAVIEFLPATDRGTLFPDAQGFSAEITPASALEILRSSAVMMPVAKDYAAKMVGGPSGIVATDVDQALAQLRETVTISPLGEGRLMEIKVRIGDPTLARDIANEVAESFKDYCEDLKREPRKRGLEQLQLEAKAQEILMEQAFVEMLKLMEDANLIDPHILDVSYDLSGSGPEEERRRTVEKHLTDVQLEILELRSRHAVLGQLGEDYEKEAKEIEIELEVGENHLAALKLMRKESNDAILSMQRRTVEYLAAKEEFHLHSAMLSEIRRQIAKRALNMQMPLYTIRVHERAVLSTLPVDN